MCPMDKTISCQISFTPIESTNYKSDVNKVLELIADADVKYDVGVLSTVVQGNSEEIFSLIKDIYSTMEPLCGFSLDIKISNICGSCA